MAYRHLTILTAALSCTSVAQHCRGSIIEFWNDPAGWTSQVEKHHYVDFVGIPVGTFITNQFHDLGITFTNIVFIHNAQSYSDGFGLAGNNGIRLEFDVPQHAFAVDHLGTTSYALFYQGDLVAKMDGWFSYPNLPGPVYFSGIVSEQPFDEVYLFKPQPPFSSNFISVDNLYWGAPQGDLNGDGVVNVLDLLILLGQWGTCDDEAPCPADLDNNGVVDIFDLFILLGNWG